MRDNDFIACSIFSGYNYYRLPNDHHIKMEYRGEHIPTGISVNIHFIKETEYINGYENLDRLEQHILHPVRRDGIEWPIDAISYRHKNMNEICYVYPLRRHVSKKKLKDLLYQPRFSEKPDWRNRSVAEDIESFLTCVMLIRDGGYYYLDYRLDSIEYDPESHRFYFGYTDAICGVDEELLYPDKAKSLSMEFAQPGIFKAETKTRDADNYAIASILFRMMIGRLPYEGGGLSNFGIVFEPNIDRDPDAHDSYFLHYHEYPVFIFDENKSDNALGLMVENDLPRQRWECLPWSIKTMFTDTFISQNGLEGTFMSRQTYDPDQWLDVLRPVLSISAEEGGK